MKCLSFVHPTATLADQRLLTYVKSYLKSQKMEIKTAKSDILKNHLGLFLFYCGIIKTA